MKTFKQQSSELQEGGNLEGYDIIGDVHGCALTLCRLLDQLGYKKRGGVYEHPTRQVIFLGDIIDRGPRIREALHIVRDMVERKSALMILGNHEINALSYSIKHPDTGAYLRPHTPSHTRQIAETLAQFQRYPYEWDDFLQWFLTLPLFLELVHPVTQQIFRAVHACWDSRLIDLHKAQYGDGRINLEFLRDAAVPRSLANLTKRRLTSGIDLDMPQGMEIVSDDGYVRRAFRVKFWAKHVSTYGELLFQPDPLPIEFASAEISSDHRSQMVYYAAHEPPLFVGHYWLKGQPEPLAPNLACLDYSAVKFGRLVAYRMDGEAELSPAKFSWVYVDP